MQASTLVSAFINSACTNWCVNRAFFDMQELSTTRVRFKSLVSCSLSVRIGKLPVMEKRSNYGRKQAPNL